MNRHSVKLMLGWLPVGLLGLSLSLNLYLLLHRTKPSTSVATVAVGDRWDRLPLQGLDGNDVSFQLKGSSSVNTVVYVFAPTCIWCKRNLANIRAASAARGHAFRFIGVSLTNDGLKEYLASTPLPFPVYSIRTDVSKRLKLLGTPATVVVAPQGNVSHVILGAFSGAAGREAERLFNIRLPRLAVVDYVSH